MRLHTANTKQRHQRERTWRDHRWEQRPIAFNALMRLHGDAFRASAARYCGAIIVEALAAETERVILNGTGEQKPIGVLTIKAGVIEAMAEKLGQCQAQTVSLETWMRS